jgi:hypothetical protein
MASALRSAAERLRAGRFAAPTDTAWDHLPMDADDSEKRIAELERQLAAQKRIVELEPQLAKAKAAPCPATVIEVTHSVVYPVQANTLDYSNSSGNGPPPPLPKRRAPGANPCLAPSGYEASALGPIAWGRSSG